jgi:hypothetical protein
LKIFEDDRATLSVEELYTVDGCTTFRIGVISGDFSGSSNFCITGEETERIQKHLENMNGTLTGTVTIYDSDSDDFITLELNERGQLTCKGSIGGSHRANSMRFLFQADQTILSPLIRVVSKVDSRVCK